jgi:hypothetical protein
LIRQGRPAKDLWLYTGMLDATYGLHGLGRL